MAITQKRRGAANNSLEASFANKESALKFEWLIVGLQKKVTITLKLIIIYSLIKNNFGV